MYQRSGSHLILVIFPALETQKDTSFRKKLYLWSYSRKPFISHIYPSNPHIIFSLFLLENLIIFFCEFMFRFYLLGCLSHSLVTLC